MTYLDFLCRISICFVLGLIIGIERQYRRRVAGMRTITLVALGSFLFVSISFLSNPVDVTRIAAQVVSGIGFLGAGVIIRDGQNIRGLNTAATLWCSAAVGTLTALGFIIEAVIGVLYILASNIILRIISKKMMNKIPAKQIEHYSLTILCDEEKEISIKNMLLQKLRTNQICIKSFNTSKYEDNKKIETTIDIASSEVDSFNNTINKLCLESGVNSVMFNKLTSYSDDDDDYEVK
jgi:putative Mg2+ transporter-C (MgtC) family protein